MPPPLLDSALAIRMNAAPVAGSKEWGELEVERGFQGHSCHFPFSLCRALPQVVYGCFPVLSEGHLQKATLPDRSLQVDPGTRILDS